MAFQAGQDEFTRGEVLEILQRNVTLYKDDPGFAEYFTALTMYLLDRHYGDGRISADSPPPPPGDRPESSVYLPSGEVDLRAYLSGRPSRDGMAEPDIDPPTESFSPIDLPTPLLRHETPAPPVRPLTPPPMMPHQRPQTGYGAAPPPPPQMPHAPVSPFQRPAGSYGAVPPPPGGVVRPPSPSIAPPPPPGVRPAMPAAISSRPYPRPPAGPSSGVSPQESPTAPPGSVRPVSPPPTAAQIAASRQSGASQINVPKLTPSMLGLPSGPSAGSGPGRGSGAAPPPPAKFTTAPMQPPPGAAPLHAHPLGWNTNAPAQQPPPQAPPPSPPAPSYQAAPPPGVLGGPTPRPISMNSRPSGVFQMPNAPLITPIGDTLRDKRGPAVPPPAPSAAPGAPPQSPLVGGCTKVYNVVRPYKSTTSLESPCPLCGGMVPMEAATCPSCGGKAH